MNIIDEMAIEWMREEGKEFSPCNCGGPSMGTGHSPDCAWERSAERLSAEWRDEFYERYSAAVDESFGIALDLAEKEGLDPQLIDRV